MRNRWFHRPRLHSPELGMTKKVTWIELFYDLIFVASFIQLGNGLSEHVSLLGFIQFAAIFVPIWLSWVGFTYYENRFSIDDFTHRIIVFIQMFSVGGMAISAPEVLEGETQAFALSCAISFGMVTIMYIRAWRHTKNARSYSRYWGIVFAFGALTWFISVLTPSPYCYALWAVGIVIIFVSPLSKQSRSLALEFPTDTEHLSERFGLLTLIVLGESFVKVLSSLSGQGVGIEVYMQASLTLLITCCIWWIYFDDVAGSHVKKQKLGFVSWFYSHLPLQIAVTAVGVAIKKAVSFDLDTVAPAKYRWLLCGALALVFFSTSLIDSVTERKQAELSDKARVNVRFASSILILLLAPAGAAMGATLFLLLITLTCVAQVIFDMMMAPFETIEGEEDTVRTSTEVAKTRLSGTSTKTSKRWDILDTVQKGAPNELRRDLYFFFMEGSWLRFLLSLSFLYLIINVFFAALYTLQSGSISEARPDSFVDAFFFSVQTMSTIGYGAMAPATEYGHILVTIEAAVGLLGVALATGLMFAKVSRPRSSVLFSKPMIIMKNHGKNVLCFRIGNARGNEVVDASMDLSVIKEEVSPEGIHIRRVLPIKLLKNRTPMFILSWLVMHEIDESSPLYEIDFSKPVPEILAFSAVMQGHDATYAQMTYARYTYYPEDIRYQHRFVDIISEQENGRLVIDYKHFHKTLPQELIQEKKNEDKKQNASNLKKGSTEKSSLESKESNTKQSKKHSKHS